MEPMTMVAGRQKWVFVLVVSVLFTIMGFIGVSNGRAFGWVSVAFFGVGVATSVRLLLRPPMLTIDEAGLASRNLLGTQRFEFSDCSEFRAWRSPLGVGKVMVTFDWAGTSRPGRRGAGNSFLPDTYGRSAEDVVALLNRRRAASAGGR
jgi:hypothetical protein